MGPNVGDGLEDLLRATWLLANLVNGGAVTDAEHGPTVRFSPGIADKGTWGCCVDIRMSDAGCSSIHGTIESCLAEINKRIDDHLGGGYRYHPRCPF